jgi:pilus assembly protein Flp/PilA
VQAVGLIHCSAPFLAARVDGPIENMSDRHLPGTRGMVPRIGHAKSQRENMKNLLKRFVREEEGQDLIEYGLLIGIITVGAIVSINLIGPKVATYFSTLNAQLP